VKIEEILMREGKYVGATAGVSMLPMLKSGRDLVVIANLYLPGFRVPISIDTFVGCESANRDHLYAEYKK